MEKTAKELMKYGSQAVLVKGGHRVMEALDVLYDGKQVYRFPGKRIDTENTHGTGCTLSAALAVMLAGGMEIPQAVEQAKKYVTGAIETAKDNKIGHGYGPVHHFWFYGKNWGHL